MGCERFKFVGCGHKGQAGDHRHVRRDGFVPTRRGIKARAHGRAALRQLVDRVQSRFDPLDPHRHLMRVARKFLRQRQWGCIHRMGAADLDDAVKLFDLFLKHRVQFL